jgi:ATP-dependent protease ClpP protease subunit
MLKRITIDGEVGREDGQVSASWVKSQLPPNGLDPIEVCIHSEGGSVIEGFAIYDALKAYAGQKRCIISSSAFSISSFIPMAFDDVEITPNGYMMLHKPYMGCEGDDIEFAKRSTLLTDMTNNMVNAYAAKSGKPTEEIKAILADETYMNATTALANGFVNRITPTPVMGRVFAKVKTMPHGIVQALFGAGLSGDKREPTKGKTVSESQAPVAATIKEIKAAYPKAKAEFIVKCMEQEMPMPKVAEAAYAEVMIDNQSLADRIAALEAQLASMAAPEAMEPPVAEEPVPPTPPVAVAAPIAKAKSGVAPLAKSKPAIVVNAKSDWLSKIQAKVNAGIKRDKATALVNKEHPGLRQQMLDEVNA